MIERRRRRRQLPTDLTPGSAPFAETGWLEPYPDSRPEQDPAQRMWPASTWSSRSWLRCSTVRPAAGRAAVAEVLGYPADEVADLLDTSTAAVNSALQRARRVVDARRPTATQQAELGELGDDKVRRLARARTDLSPAATS